MTKTAWHDPSHEGKIMRRVINALTTRFTKEAKKGDLADIDKMCKLAITISQTSHIKDMLARSTDYVERIRRIQEELARRRENPMLTV